MVYYVVNLVNLGCLLIFIFFCCDVCRLLCIVYFFKSGFFIWFDNSNDVVDIFCCGGIDIVVVYFFLYSGNL